MAASPPQGTEGSTTSGSVSRAVVIAVLKAAGISCTASNEAADGTITVTIYQDGDPTAYNLPSIVRRKMLHRLQMKHNVKIEWFYNPHMVINATTTAQ
jgi:hypothetical protein